jgi:endonuclease-3 related protein
MEPPCFDVIYKTLLSWYGPQGWFPLVELHERNGVNPTKSGSINGYHPGDYSYPKNREQQFEICVGCILTQNTSWPNVERALLNLKKMDALTPDGLATLSLDTLKETIRPAGYYNQKARYLKAFVSFFNSLGERTPTRKALLAVTGIGEETADAILLYSFRQPVFVADTYSRRIFRALGLMGEKGSYQTIKSLVENNFKGNYKEYQEFHALLVEHAKRFYTRTREVVTDPLLCVVEG